MSPITVRTYRPGDEPAVRKGGAVLPSSNAVSEAARRDRGRTTLAAIAAEAGVSLPTVSKVVNGRRDVAPATRALIERLLHERAGEPRYRGGDPGDLRAHRQAARAAMEGRHPAGRARLGEPAATGPA